MEDWEKAGVCVDTKGPQNREARRETRTVQLGTAMRNQILVNVCHARVQ